MRLRNPQMVPVTHHEVTPEEFRRLDRHSVAAVTVRPPRLGEDGFGGLLVRYRTPVYRFPSPWQDDAGA